MLFKFFSLHPFIGRLACQSHTFPTCTEVCMWLFTSSSRFINMMLQAGLSQEKRERRIWHGFLGKFGFTNLRVSNFRFIQTVGQIELLHMMPKPKNVLLSSSEDMDLCSPFHGFKVNQEQYVCHTPD